VRFRRDTDAGATEHRAPEFGVPGLTPEFLVGLFEQYITSEAEVIIGPHDGKWMRVAGPRGTTVPRRRGVTILRFDRRPGAPFTRVEMQFREADAQARLDAIPRGTEVVVAGSIASITRSQIVLDHCEIEGANPRSQPPL
jgi:hypothetical protein